MGVLEPTAASVCVCAAHPSSSAVSIQPSMADIQEGQSLELNCVAPGSPPPRVTWSRAGGLSSNHQVGPAAGWSLWLCGEISGSLICSRRFWPIG